MDSYTGLPLRWRLTLLVSGELVCLYNHCTVCFKSLVQLYKEFRTKEGSIMSPYEIILVILQTDMVVISAIALVLNGIKKRSPGLV